MLNREIRRHVPVVTVVIDTSARIASAFAIIEELTTKHGLVTSEVVLAMTAPYEAGQPGGLRLAQHDF